MHSAPHHSPPEKGDESDLCLQIQVDLSAMVDGELEAASVRRATAHVDACSACRAFLEGIQRQAGLHRRLAAANAAGGAAAPRRPAAQGGVLRGELTRRRAELARDLYERGRSAVLMGLSPDPVGHCKDVATPAPEASRRDRRPSDEPARAGEAVGDWDAMMQLLDAPLQTPEEHLARGQRLLSECLALEEANDGARIYLGLVHQARGQRALARKQLQRVVARSRDVTMRCFAQFNLSSICLDEGDCESAIRLLLELVASGAVERDERWKAAWLNLGLAYGLRGEFEESARWFRRLHEDGPGQRSSVARGLSRRSGFLHLVRAHPQARQLADDLQQWFFGPRRS